MKIAVIALVICVCMCLAAADVVHLRAKARLAARLAGKLKHHKRGVLSPVPPFKLGHDIPLVTHSVVKPIVVTYPPTSSVTAVKVPLAHPHSHRYPVSVGHKGNPHSHFGQKHPHTNTVLVPKPDHHFHHHHHHVDPKPVVPILPAPPVPATPIVPIAQPTGTIAHPIPAPSPPVLIQPGPFVPPQPVPIAPPPLHFLPSNHVKPILPATTIPFHPPAAVPLRPAAIPLPQAPLIPAPVPLAPQYQYVIRPGNAVQSSFFATYPRYPLLNYQNPFLPLASPIAPAIHPSVNQVLLQRPQVPSFHLVPQAAVGEGVLEQPAPTVPVEPTLIHPTQAVPQPTVHLQPTQPAISIDNNGWSPVPPQAHDITPVHHPEAHFPQPEHHFTQEQGTQVFEHHTASDQQYHDYQNHLQQHIQQQLEQAQYEQNLNHQHQLNQEYGAPQNLNHEYGQPNQEYPVPTQDYSQHNQDFPPHNPDYSQHVQDYAQHAQDYAQHAQEYAQHGQEYAQHAQEYAQHGQDYAQHAQEYPQHGQEYAQQEYAQHGQDVAGNEFNLAHQQLGQEYGLPQAEGRSEDAEEESEAQRYHNHIPLGLQPPINRPPEHFR
ncbi:YLP motif-containing protein 1-like [Achroia grisella]|uniref:YLP motif-containing protein 1-like n=1 Tax=Achroia grisella TaxID=688607 RepID=UPI0027D2C47B|nr:YLP motif-containing protein 1-like [Achroia grisella]